MFYVTAIIEMTHPENNFDETFQGLKQLEKYLEEYNKLVKEDK